MPNPDADPNRGPLSYREDSDQRLSDVDIESSDDVERAATGFPTGSANTSKVTGQTELSGHTEERTKQADQAPERTKSYKRVKSTRLTEATGPTRLTGLVATTELAEKAENSIRNVSPAPAKGSEMTNLYGNHPLVQGVEAGGGGQDKDGAGANGGGKKMGLKRLETQEFQEYRETEAREGGAGIGGGWNKMAIIKIHKPEKKPEPKYANESM